MNKNKDGILQTNNERVVPSIKLKMDFQGKSSSNLFKENDMKVHSNSGSTGLDPLD